MPINRRSRDTQATSALRSAASDERLATSAGRGEHHEQPSVGLYYRGGRSPPTGLDAMAHRAYMAWLQKKESKVIRPRIPPPSEAVEPAEDSDSTRESAHDLYGAGGIAVGSTLAGGKMSLLNAKPGDVSSRIRPRGRSPPAAISHGVKRARTTAEERNERPPVFLSRNVPASAPQTTVPHHKLMSTRKRNASISKLPRGSGLLKKQKTTKNYAKDNRGSYEEKSVHQLLDASTEIATLDTRRPRDLDDTGRPIRAVIGEAQYWRDVDRFAFLA